jgi:hypothetical protein
VLPSTYTNFDPTAISGPARLIATKVGVGSATGGSVAGTLVGFSAAGGSLAGAVGVAFGPQAARTTASRTSPLEIKWAFLIESSPLELEMAIPQYIIQALFG